MKFILQTLRRDKNISQKELAKISNVSISYIQKLESGNRNKPSGEVVVKLAAALNSTVEELFLKEE